MAKKRTTKKKTVVKKKTVAKKKTVVKKKKTTVKKAGSKRGAGLNKITYSVTSELAAIIGNKRFTRPQIVKELWAYIKAKKCQDEKNKRMINPDSKLAAVLGSRPVDMLKLAGLLNKHIKA
jgi:chromatin remodeling complex protein RSC6